MARTWLVGVLPHKTQPVVRGCRIIEECRGWRGHRPCLAGSIKNTRHSTAEFAAAAACEAMRCAQGEAAAAAGAAENMRGAVVVAAAAGVGAVGAVGAGAGAGAGVAAAYMPVASYAELRC